jgi:hypothetical protein
VKAEKGGLWHGSGHPWEEAGLALSLSSAIFWVQTWARGLSRQEKWGQGTKVCIVTQSQSQGWSDWPLSQSKCSQRGFRENVIADITGGDLSGSHEMLAPAPGCSLIIIGHCPHLEGCLSCKCPLFFVGSFSPLPWRCDHLFFLESKVIEKWLQRELLRAKTDAKWRQGCQASPVFS